MSADKPYGRTRLSSQPTFMPAARFSIQLHRGITIAGGMVRQSCGNTRCVNPDHLRMDSDITPEEAKKEVEKYFWSRVDKSGKCWIWTGPEASRGYGQIQVTRGITPRRFMLVHRYSLELHGTTVPAHLLVCHHCDNPPCVRPCHLFVGTTKDNAIDASNKGLLAGNSINPTVGIAHPHAKLNMNQVSKIREQTALGLSQADIASAFHVSKPTIAKIQHGKSYYK